MSAVWDMKINLVHFCEGNTKLLHTPVHVLPLLLILELDFCMCMVLRELVSDKFKTIVIVFLNNCSFGLEILHDMQTEKGM
jgi:hypothetical protein